MSDYKYLFPFELVPQGADIVIYGAGTMGSAYLEQMLMTKYANVQCFLDRKAASYDDMVVPIYTPERVRELSYDYIILAFQTNAHYKAVTKTLQGYGVSQEKIIIPPIRHHIKINNSSKETLDTRERDYAWQSGGLSAAIMLNLSVGDNIIRKKVIEALIAIAPDIRIDLYSPVAETYLPWIYRGCSNIHSFIVDGGALYHIQSHHYNFAMTVANFIQLDYLNLDGLEKKQPLFVERMRLLEQRVQEAGIDFFMPMNNFFARAIKQGKNCYTVYGYDGVFDIRDKDAHIELAPEFQEEYEQLSFAGAKYITINYGNAVSMTHAQIIAKQWPLEYLEDFVLNFKLKYQDIKVIQVSGKDAHSVQGADYKLIGKPLELTAHILKHALFHMDIEGGLVHLATQLGTKCIVLFGPTQEKYFGYEQNINIKAGTCHDCYGMWYDINRCARDMNEPECMYSITPEMVMERVDECLKMLE